MPSLFDVIPDRLFAPLAARGAVAYADMLLSLFVETQRHQQPLSRDLAVDVTSDILARPGMMQTTDEAAGEDDNLLADPDDDALRQRAGAVLRYFARCGWLRIETDSDFTRTCVLPTYTFPLLQVFSEMATHQQRPLQRVIYTIHALLQAAAHEDDPTDALQEAHRETAYLRNRLKELQLNIGAHIEKVVQKHLHARDALHQFFATYRDEIVDSAYHQLRTSDHVSRYRPGIIEALAVLEKPSVIETVAQNLSRSKEARGVEEATIRVADQIRDIREYFEAFDSVLGVIGTRHEQFVDAAVRAVELHLAASTTTSGQLHSILTHLLSSGMPGSGTTHATELPPEYDSIHTMHKLLLVDEFSPVGPARASVPFVADAEVRPGRSPADDEVAREETFRQLRATLSRRKVGHFVLEALAGRDQMQASEMAVSTPADVPLLIYTRLYGDGRLGYRVEDDHNGPWVERGEIKFRDFAITRVVIADHRGRSPFHMGSPAFRGESSRRTPRREPAGSRQERLAP